MNNKSLLRNLLEVELDLAEINNTLLKLIEEKVEARVYLHGRSLPLIYSPVIWEKDSSPEREIWVFDSPCLGKGEIHFWASNG
jgi:hypothetical protein